MSNIIFIFFHFYAQLEIQPVPELFKAAIIKLFLFPMLDADAIIDTQGGALWRRRKYVISV